MGSAHCDGGVCTGDLPNGQPCDEASDYQSGICNDDSDVCCPADCGPGVGCTGPSGTCAPTCGTLTQTCCAGDTCDSGLTRSLLGDCCTCAAGGSYPASASIPAQPGGAIIDTGIFMNVGECVTISAAGTILRGGNPGQPVGPDGSFNAAGLYDSAPGYALLAQTDFSQLPAYIVEGPRQFRALNAGTLKLRMNALPSDTSTGSFAATFGCGGACQPVGAGCSAMDDCCSGFCTSAGTCAFYLTCGSNSGACCIGKECLGEAICDTGFGFCVI